MAKKFLIVGGSSSMAKELIQLLHQKGDTLYVISRQDSDAFHEQNIQFFQHDVLDQNAPFPNLSESVDGIVYFPGTITLKPFLQLKKEDFYHDWEINFLGAVRTIQTYLPKLNTTSGSIVLISSIAASCGLAYHGSIGPAKSAIEGLTRSLAAEIAPIRVNAVAPSITDTPLAHNLLNTDAKKESSIKRHPLHGIASPDQIAKGVEFLLSENASRITGHILPIDGGLGSIKQL